MSELRRDPTSGRQVIVAPGRSGRPDDVHPPKARGGRALRLDPECPFCPGSEGRLPGLLAETADDRAPGWRVRVVPNKYPALDPPQAGPSGAGVRGGHVAGFHEVIIESPFHDADLATLDDTQVEAVARAYRDRCRTLLARPGIQAVVLFRNHGPASGASLRHPHAQAVALPFVPPLVQALAETGAARHRQDGRCPACEALAAPGAQGRMIEETEHFVALAPHAAQRPGETWITPRVHQASFADLDDARLAPFARLLGRTLRRLGRAYDDPSYSFVIDSADRDHRRAPYVHWRLRIAPKLAEWGGFELGAEMAINPSSPELDAEHLRRADPARP